MTVRDDDSEERLLIEAAQQDPRRFAELYEQNFERLYAYIVSRVRNRSEAEDITAEVFHHALAKIRSFEWRGIPFAAWLYRVASNIIVDRAHAAAREHTGAARDAMVEPDFEDIQRRTRMFRLVRSLPAEQATVIVRRFVEEKSIREIAGELGKSEGAVKQLQLRGLKNLRDRLGESNG